MFRYLYSDRSRSPVLRYSLLVLFVLRFISTQYLVLSLAHEVHLTAHPAVRPQIRRQRRDTFVDWSVIVQFGLAIVLWWLTPYLKSVAAWLSIYLLLVLYVSLLNILLFGGVPVVSRPSASTSRSLVLLLLNCAQLIFHFAVFYQVCLMLEPLPALVGAFAVFGTVGMPAGGETSLVLAAQIILDCILYGVAISTFSGRLRLSSGP